MAEKSLNLSAREARIADRARLLQEREELKITCNRLDMMLFEAFHEIDLELAELNKLKSLIEN
jgi:hypothetical protein